MKTEATKFVFPKVKKQIEKEIEGTEGQNDKK